jgi:hypothetical protein
MSVQNILIFFIQLAGELSLLYLIRIDSCESSNSNGLSNRSAYLWESNFNKKLSELVKFLSEVFL